MVLEDLHDFSATGYDAGVFSSPAMGVYDLNASVSSNSSHVGTVSPNDLLLQDSFMSAPNSSALTALTSPSDYNDSPYIDSYDVSPNFGSSDVDAVGGHDAAWFPLFDQINTAVAGAPVADAEASPASESLDMVSSAEKSEGTSSRRKAGHVRSPSSSAKHSSSSGVGSRRRDKPLAPIVVEDPLDTVAMKRARNTLAARKSRQRKQERLDELEETIAKLTAERDHWKKLALNQ